MTSTLLEDTGTATAAPKTPEPVTLRTAHDYTLTHAALDSRKEELKKLAKKNADEGYLRESRAVQADADAIEHHIIPAFHAQRELPLVTHAQLEKEVEGALRTFIYQAFNGLGDPKIIATPEAIASRRNMLLTALATRVTLYVKDVADEAFNQGVAAREQSSEALAMRSVATLRKQGD